MATSFKKFTGKKLLLLGTNPGTTDMVNYARSQGAYVIVTDNQPAEKSAAKRIADETWPVSTADVDTLKQLAIQHQVNGIFAGVSEFNLEKVLTLCERLGLPFYCTRKQWETCNNKRLFKQLCHANDVPVPKEYKIDINYKEEDLKQIKYPVIVKPVDKSAGTGIRICRNKEELIKGYEKAISISNTNQAIVEEFLKADEFWAGYTIKEGRFSLTLIVDRYVSQQSKDTSPLPMAMIWPSKYTNRYIAELNNKVIEMFKSIGLANGFIFVQGKINKGSFRVFEANYRLNAGPWYRAISRVNRINYLEMLVDYALTGKMGEYDLSLDNPKINRYFCNFVLISKGGLVGKLIGLESILNNKNILLFEKWHDVGDYIEKSGTLKQIVLRFELVADNLEETKNSIKEIQNTVKVLDDKGNNMLLPAFDTNRI